MQISGVNNPMKAAKWGKTPLIQKKAVEASKNAMIDDFVKKLQELAREDAQKGVCMDKKPYRCVIVKWKNMSPRTALLQ